MPALRLTALPSPHGCTTSPAGNPGAVEAVAAVDKAAAALAEQPELEPTFMPEGAYGGGRAPDEPPNHGNKVGAHCCCGVDGLAAWFATFDVLPTEWASEWAARLCHLLAALLSHCACLPPCLRVSACLPACLPACVCLPACAAAGGAAGAPRLPDGEDVCGERGAGLFEEGGGGGFHQASRRQGGLGGLSGLGGRAAARVARRLLPTACPACRRQPSLAPQFGCPST